MHRQFRRDKTAVAKNAVDTEINGQKIILRQVLNTLSLFTYPTATTTFSKPVYLSFIHETQKELYVAECSTCPFLKLKVNGDHILNRKDHCT